MVLNYNDWLINENVYYSHLYFAYGSNLSLKQLKDRSFIHSKTPAKLYDYELVFNKISKKNPGVGMGNIVEKKGSVVEGMAYELDNIAVGILDKSEGVPVHYFKDVVKIQLESGEMINAITYIANPKMIDNSLLPARSYVDKFLVDGRKYLSKEYIKKLEDQKTVH